MHSTPCISAPCDNINEAVISVTRKALKENDKNTQVLHIIYASLIQTDKKWTTVIDFFREDDNDGDGARAITFGHLPKKYEEVYDDLLPELDNLNLIDNDSIWCNIKYFLLDLYFYQAVHFQALERITDTGGGYFKEKKDVKLKLETEFTFDLDGFNNQAIGVKDKVFQNSFYEAVETKGIQKFKTREDLMRRGKQKRHINPESDALRKMLRHIG